MLPGRIFSTFQTASQGLAVQREKIAVASRNIANANTSAPKDSVNTYRPQSVRSLAPGLKSFENVLRDSVSSLKRTDAQHFEMSPNSISSNNATPQGLGPEFEVVETDSYRYEYDPNHPDADENGMVRYPEIDLMHEMTQMISANRLYEANLSSIEAEKEIIKRSLDI